MFRLVAISVLTLTLAATAAEPADRTAPAAPTAIPVVAQDLPMGRCRLHYETLPAGVELAPMECAHAHWLGARWGGTVLEQTQTGLAPAATYEGANDFTGVPSDALPHAGWCRAWIDGRAPATQPAQSDCRTARRIAREQDGRVIFMPL